MTKRLPGSSFAATIQAMTTATPTPPLPLDDPALTVRTPEALQALLGPVGETALRKEVDHVHPLYARMIEASPFVALATCDAQGLDVSPRGDPAGFIEVLDEKTLLLPERRGNNRADSLHNILRDPRVALLFLIPGRGETLRVNGRARISIDPALLQRFEMDGKPPKCVLVIRVETVFFQCARAIQRSRLWEPRTGADIAQVPSPGTILGTLSAQSIDGEAYDRELPGRQKATLY